MNPYTPPTSELSPPPPLPEVRIKNPARFLLYPLSAFCLFFFGVTSQRYLISGIRFRSVELINMGGTVVMGILGVSAVYLAVLKLSKRTRIGTMLWSGTTVSILLISLYFEPPATIHDFNVLLVTGTVLLFIGILAYRSGPVLQGTAERDEGIRRSVDVS